MNDQQELRDRWASIEVLACPRNLVAGRPATFRLRVRNQGEQTWPHGGEHPVRVAYHWRDTLGRVVVAEGERSSLERDLATGQACEIDCRVQAPDAVGTFVLELDLVEEFITWFAKTGSPTVQIRCDVISVPCNHFDDYQDPWEAADLDTDYWSVVGPASEEEFQALTKHKCSLLIDLGLTPSSRVLDVGCGTGCLTDGLADFLDDTGLYFGTDVASQAIDFCRRKYTRSNFHFLVNDQTHVGIEGQSFDFITLFSVFTHMYPKEIEVMLGSLKKLLDAKGIIVVDAFVKRPGGEAATGSREMVEIDERVLLATLEKAGFAHRALETLAEYGDTRRRLFCLSHATDEVLLA